MSANDTVGDHAPEQRREIGQAGIPAIEIARLGPCPSTTWIISSSLVDEIEHQERAHAIIAESFPHLDDEQEE